jgi:TolB-like protein
MKKLGNTLFDEAAQLLRDGSGKKIALRSQSIQVLVALFKAQGALCTKDELIKAVWGKTIVGDDSLVQCIKEIRQALGDTAHEILQTTHRRGYRLVVPEAAEASEAVAADLALEVAQAPNSELTSPVYAKPSLAILAFTSYEGDERSERLALSFAGDLNSELARHSEFRLVSRHSAFALRGKNLSSREICERLDVKYFVGGQVQFAENGLRWSIELVNGVDDQVVWSEHKEVKYADMNLAKDELTWRIACSVYNVMRRSARTLALARPPQSLDAYETSAIALAALFKTTISATRESQLLAAAAVKKFPTYARAWMVLANTHFWDMLYAHTGEWHEGRVTELLEEIQNAIALDPSEAYAFGIFAAALTSNGQYEEALVATERAIALAPSDADMLQYKTATLFCCGNLEESLALSQTMMARMPVRTPPHLASHGRVLYFSGQQREGMKFLMEAVSVTPGGNQARISLIVAQHEAGEHVQAAEHFQHLRRNTTNFSSAYFGRRWTLIPEIRERYLSALGTYGLE